jgi:hypothetical protein
MARAPASEWEKAFNTGFSEAATASIPWGSWKKKKPKKGFVSELKSNTGRIENKEWEFAAYGYIPLAPSLLKDMEHDVKGVYHVTDIAKYNKLKSIQNRRIDIPCFTKGSWSVVGGLHTDAEMLVTLNGKASAVFEGDVNTYLDRNGLRWLSTVGQGALTKDINDIVQEFSMTILPEVVKEFGIQTHTGPAVGKNKYKSKLVLDVGNFIYDKDGSTKRKFMRFYYDKAKKLVRKPLIDKINKALGWRKNQNLTHNEILVHNFKIVNTKLIVSEESSKSDLMWERASKKDMLHWDTIQAADVADLIKK